MFSEPICDLVSDINLGKTLVITVSNISFVCLLVILIHVCYKFHSYPRVLGYSVLFFFGFCSLCFSVLKVYIEISSESPLSYV